MKTKNKKTEFAKHGYFEKLQFDTVRNAIVKTSCKSSSCRFENCHCCKYALKDAIFMGTSDTAGESDAKSNNNFQDCNKIKNDSENLIKQNISSNNEVPTTSVYDYDEDDQVDEFKNIDSTRTCQPCKIVFENPLDLLRHRRDSHNFPKPIVSHDEIEKYFDCPNRNICPICKKPIKTRNFRSVFIKHLLTHTIGMTYACTVCKKIFKRRDHMKIHQKRHIVSL